MKLSTYLRKNPGAANRLAKALRVSAPSVCDWKWGRKLPSPWNAIEIDRFTDGLVSAEEARPDFADAFKYLRSTPKRRR